ncbi:MAG TPA: universal stress protein [Planctomycetaceae bacterium]|jgi:universal stress protein E
MPLFRNIVVGIDLSHLEHPPAAKFTPPVEEAISRAIWLAEKTAGRLTFLTVLDRSEYFVDVLGARDQEPVVKQMETLAAATLDRLVLRAQENGVEARPAVRWGKGFVEIIRQVLQENHDLAIVGARDLRTVKRLLFGSTAMQLVRKCPCPVWVTKPVRGSQTGLRNIAIASDFSPVADAALKVAVDLARYAGSKVHLVNSVDYPLDRTWITGLPDATLESYHEKIRKHAADKVRQQLGRVETAGLTTPVETDIVEGMLNPDVAILKFIKERKIDLLAMGTIALSGIKGVVVGNMAERLLPQVNCSVLAFKPKEFHCPIAMAEPA